MEHTIKILDYAYICVLVMRIGSIYGKNAYHDSLKVTFEAKNSPADD